MSTSRIKKLSRNPATLETSRSDPELMAAIAAGDLGALGLLYDRYQADLLRFFLRMRATGSDADDLVHETFLRLVRAARLYDGRPSARGFVIGVGAKVLRGRRRSIRRLGEVLRSFAAGLSGASAVSPEAEAGGSETRDHIEAALARLSPEKRMTFLMIEAEGMTGEEVALALEIPVATVWTRLHHARLSLRKSLARKGQS